MAAPKGDGVRPATDAMRQAVFSSLGNRVPGCRFLDLFAGSGAYGLEAVSRGAETGIFVEDDAKAVACIRENLAAVCKSLRRDLHGLEVFQRDATTAGAPLGTPPDLVFIDPPYEIIASIGPALVARLTPWLRSVEDPVIVFEMPGETQIDCAGWSCVKRLGKGARQPTVCFLKRTAE